MWFFVDVCLFSSYQHLGLPQLHLGSSSTSFSCHLPPVTGSYASTAKLVVQSPTGEQQLDLADAKWVARQHGKIAYSGSSDLPNPQLKMDIYIYKYFFYIHIFSSSRYTSLHISDVNQKMSSRLCFMKISHDWIGAQNQNPSWKMRTCFCEFGVSMTSPWMQSNSL